MSEGVIETWSLGDYQRVATEHVIVSERLCADLAVGTAHRVLDVACGTGNTAIAAARRRATVTGCDLVPDLLHRARQREQAEGVAPIEWVTGDAAHLPFDDGTFDVTLSTFGAVFVPDQEQAAAELLRVTKPGGTIGLTSYTSASMPADIYWVGAQFLAPKPGQRPAFDWAAGQRAGELLGPGSSSVLVTPLSYGACYESARAYVDCQLQNYGPMVRRFQQMSQVERSAYAQQVMEAAERHNEATDGSLIATFDYVQIVARKAG